MTYSAKFFKIKYLEIHDILIFEKYSEYVMKSTFFIKIILKKEMLIHHHIQPLQHDPDKLNLRQRAAIVVDAAAARLLETSCEYFEDQ